MKISICPITLSPYADGFFPAASKTLFGVPNVSPCISYDFDKDIDKTKLVENVGRLSISGAQEKLGAVISDGMIQLTPWGQKSTHILKPAPLDFSLTARRQIPANEHLTMQIASQVYGIATAPNGLCFDMKNRPAYITKRFDILPNGKKILIEDFATLCNKNEQTDGKYFKYEGSYQDIAIALKQNVAAAPVDLDRFYRQIIFNYIFANGDAHMKNFSLVYAEGEFRLSPAYDLLNTSLHLDGDDLGLQGGLFRNGWRSEIFERTNHPCKLDFGKFGIEIGLTSQRVDSIIKSFAAIPEKALRLIGNSYLSDKMKRKYLLILQQRIARFRRE